MKPKAFYVSQVDQGVQQQCLLCHRASGAASQSGARLVLSVVPCLPIIRLSWVYYLKTR